MLNREELLKSEKGPRYTSYGKKLKAALAYPNFYHVGMANLGFQTIYHLLNSYLNTYCERVFLTQEKKIVSFETGQTLSSFDLLLFSVTFELDYIHIAEILEKGKIPLLSSERDESHPLVCGGGICTFLNPEPIAPFFDFFVIGEAEEVLGEVISLFNSMFPQGIKRKKDRIAFLKEISGIEGIYVPQFYEFIYDKNDEIVKIKADKNIPGKIKRLYIRDMNSLKILPQTITPESSFGKMFLIEIGRGCPYKCCFCGAASVYKPYRYRDVGIIRKIVQEQIDVESFGLISPAISSHPHLESLMDLFLEYEQRVSLSSLRIDKIDKKMASFLSRNDQKTVTLAPECGSKKMRDLVRKDISEDNILEAIENLVDMKIRNIKLYFMIGLPGETRDDVLAIYGLTQKIRNVTMKKYKSTKKLTKIIVHITPYVPKPHTLWRDIPMARERDLKDKIMLLKKAIYSLGSVRLETEDVKSAILQSILSRGDRRVNNFIISLAKEKKDWKTVSRNMNFEWNKYLSVDHYGSVLPWEHIG